jgi:DNA-binding response OmpR family regulator
MARTILIVDDEDRFGRLARLVLESEGYEMVGDVPDGDSALRAARGFVPKSEPSGRTLSELIG